MPTRRTFLAGSLTIAAGTTAWGADNPVLLQLSTAEPFDFDILTDRARALADEPYSPPDIAMRDVLETIDYDAHWKIRFREDATFSPPGSDAQIQLFYPGRYFPEPVAMYLVDGTVAQEIVFGNRYFTMPDDSPARALGNKAGFAGFRVMRPGLGPDWVSFLGASYFRTDGPDRQYGLSARGLAIDTGLGQPEEFPRFSAFWLAGPQDPGDALTVFALLESPSVAGAYRFGLARGADGDGHTTSVASRLFFRRTPERVGIAPLTSMYWYSQADRRHARDWRPEIHDSDGLAMKTGGGERIWRPLNNPPVVRTSSFADNNPQGFGLIQRDREFAHYQDDGVFYNRRPSAWVEPISDWGPGAVQLIEIPAEDETFDNVVAYWMPQTLPAPGEMRAFDYRIHWVKRDPVPETAATVVATWQGQGGIPGQHLPVDTAKMVVDFDGPSLKGLTTLDGVEAVVTINGGRIASEIGAHHIVDANGWRMVFDYQVDGTGPAELRGYLRKDGEALTETWIAQADPAR